MLFRTVYLIILLLSNNCLLGQTKRDVIRNIIEFNSNLKGINYEFIEYLKMFSNIDTFKTLRHCYIHKKNNYGYSNFYDSGKIVNQMVYDSNQLIQYNSNNNSFYLSHKDSLYSDYNYKKSSIEFPGFSFTKKKFKSYKFKNKKSEYFVFSLKSKMRLKTYKAKFKSIIYVSKKNYMPLMYEYNIYNKKTKETQFRQYKLLNLNENIDSVKLKYSVDSLFNELKKRVNGDSAQKEFLKSIKEVKVKDSAKAITGLIHGKDSIKENIFLKDSIVILDFFFTTCPPCAESIPILLKLNETYKNKGVKLYGINPFESDWSRLDKYIKVFKINYDLIKVDKDLSRKYGVKAYPTLMIIKNGVIEFTHVGYDKDLEKIVTEKLNLLLK